MSARLIDAPETVSGPSENELLVVLAFGSAAVSVNVETPPPPGVPPLIVQLPALNVTLTSPAANVVPDGVTPCWPQT
jgi:hypothetical protein